VAECFSQSPYASNTHLPSSVCSSASREISFIITALVAFMVTLIWQQNRLQSVKCACISNNSTMTTLLFGQKTSCVLSAGLHEGYSCVSQLFPGLYESLILFREKLILVPAVQITNTCSCSQRTKHTHTNSNTHTNTHTLSLNKHNQLTTKL